MEAAPHQRSLAAVSPPLHAASAAKRKQLVVVRSSGLGTDLLLSSWAPPSFRAKLLAFIAAAFGRGS